ncbi:aminodeoxychorismate lyase [Sphingomonas oleivorans]|uniref:Endolytic murein transglycosylase n=1 Tax=Sphingomonas oleivorans TaxID=1735121 RepID=A0A2T5FV18_9SPHN|nr:endolytic transglycosylase MltG [Sphingomonas oleivorans]PTQ08570.1 aminodeoxychorismate lyase [Sphingomonas oleivorans]
MARKRRRRSSSRLGRLFIVLGIAIALVGGAIVYMTRGWTGPGPNEAPVTVVVQKGSSLAAAARSLEKAGAIRSTTNFLKFARWFGSDDPIRAGEYEVPARASGADILKLLQSGKTVQRLVTIPEGMPAILVHEKLMAEPLLTGPVAVPAEGSVLPDSYSFERGEPRAAVLKRMQAAMSETVDTLWKARKPATIVKSKKDAVILASIVEKETGVPSERRMVAAVYSNRIRTGMRLQADPTTIYPITKGKPLGRRIRRSELDAINGYNTYAIAGLPEGPIANPGRESIAAVLDPAPSNALYFVADGKGGHVFAETLGQHQANVQRYYAIRRARGEM